MKLHDATSVTVTSPRGPRPFLPSEEVAIWRTLHPEAKAKAKEREREGGRAKGSGKFPDAGQARDKVAARLGVSGRSLEKAIAIVEAAEAYLRMAKVWNNLESANTQRVALLAFRDAARRRDAWRDRSSGGNPPIVPRSRPFSRAAGYRG